MGCRHVRRDPGPCPVCDAPHTTCVAPIVGAITIALVPARDGVEPAPLVGGIQTTPLVGAVPPLVADVVQSTLPPGEFTSGTYRGKKRGR
jgi:hypothetical protein